MRLFVSVSLNKEWFRGFLYGVRGGTWSKLRNDIVREVEKACGQVGSSCELRFVFTTSTWPTNGFLVHTYGEYRAQVPRAAKAREVTAAAKKTIQRMLTDLRGGFYVTTYCNFAHDVKTGKPIDHECIKIPPAALRAEMDGDYEKAVEILRKQKK